MAKTVVSDDNIQNLLGYYSPGMFTQSRLCSWYIL